MVHNVEETLEYIGVFTTDKIILKYFEVLSQVSIFETC